MVINMSHMLNISTASNFASQAIMLNWAKKSLDAEVYKKIKKSYSDIIKYTVIVLLVLIVIDFIAIMSASSIQASQQSYYDTWKRGHVSGDTVWYINNIKYEVSLSDYGYDPVNFSDGDIFRVYLDGDGNVLKISSDADVNKFLEDDIMAVAMVGGLILMLVVFLCIHLPIAYNTYGKIWRKYATWYQKADLKYDTFTLE